jgi:hypothetical protein
LDHALAFYGRRIDIWRRKKQRQGDMPTLISCGKVSDDLRQDIWPPEDAKQQKCKNPATN